MNSTQVVAERKDSQYSIVVQFVSPLLTALAYINLHIWDYTREKTVTFYQVSILHSPSYYDEDEDEDEEDVARTVK